VNKFLSLTVLFFLLTRANGQTFVSDKISGKPYFLITYDNIRGSAFLFEEWKPSNVLDVNGYEFLNVLVKFDAYANKFFYSHGDTTYEFVTKIEEVTLYPGPGDSMIFKKGFSVPDKISADKFVQVLAEGKMTAIKYISKALQETIEYNVPGKVKVFTDKTAFYFISGNNAVSQRPNQKLLQDLLKDKWPPVEAFIKQNSLNLKKEDDCIRAIRYYNSL